MVWLLDIDGTLVRTDDIYFDTFVELLKPLGHEVDVAFYQANVHGKVDDEVFGNLLPKGHTPEQRLEMSRQKDALFCKKASERGMAVITGLGEALAWAKSSGIRCIAVSNAPRGACQLALQHLRNELIAGDIIEGLVVGAECKHAKPFPDPYIEGMGRLGGVDPERCVIFEDSRSGVKAGEAAGVSKIVGIRTSLSDTELREAGCCVTVADWTEVTPSLLTSLQGNASGVMSSASAPATATQAALSSVLLADGNDLAGTFRRGFLALISFTFVWIARQRYHSIVRHVQGAQEPLIDA